VKRQSMAGRRSWSAAKKTQARSSRDMMDDRSKHGRLADTVMAVG